MVDHDEAIHGEEEPPVALAMLIVLFVAYALFLVTTVWWARDHRGGAILSFCLVLCWTALFVGCILYPRWFSWAISSSGVSRWFSVGGQGYLSPLNFAALLSNPANLNPVLLLSKVVAGGYTAVMAAAFGLPLLFALLAYVLPAVDLDREEGQDVEHDGEGAADEAIVGAYTTTSTPPDERDWVCLACLCENLPAAKSCVLCHTVRPSATNDDNPTALSSGRQFEEANSGEDIAEVPSSVPSAQLPELGSLPFDALEVLCVLGVGITSTVLLVRFSLQRLLTQGEERRLLLPDVAEGEEENDGRKGGTPILQRDGGAGLAVPTPHRTQRGANTVSGSLFFIGDDDEEEEGRSMHTLALRRGISWSSSCGDSTHLPSPQSCGIDASKAPHQTSSEITAPSSTASSPVRPPLQRAASDDAWWRPLHWLDEAECESQGIDPGCASLAEHGSVPSFASLASYASVTSSSVAGGVGGADFSDSSSSVAPSSLRTPPLPEFYPRVPPVSPDMAAPHSPRGRTPSVNNVDQVLALLRSKGRRLWSAAPAADAESSRLPPLPLESCPALIAIKCVNKRHCEGLRLRPSVERELVALRRCTNASPFVCALYGAFQDEHWAPVRLCRYLVLEPVPAGDLAGLLKQRGLMFETEARFCIACVLLALEHLHTHGITCLDVKPENLLLDQFGYLKLCDLGIAMCVDESDGGGGDTLREAGGCWEFVGTPEYMAPEVIKQERRAPGIAGVAGPDCWSTGVLLYELLVGEAPFVAEDVHSTGGSLPPSSNAHATLDLILRYADEECKLERSRRELRARARRRRWRWSGRRRSGVEMEDAAQLSCGNVEGGGGPAERESSAVEFSLLQFPDRSLTAEGRKLIRALLRPEPERRLGCHPLRHATTGGTEELQQSPGTGSGGVCSVMKHAWFNEAAESSDIVGMGGVEATFWRPLRERRLRAPFVPHPATLPPPFRPGMEQSGAGTNVTLFPTDITRRAPLTLSQLQAAIDLRDKDDPPVVPTRTCPPPMWRGFALAARAPIAAPTLYAPRTTAGYPEGIAKGELSSSPVPTSGGEDDLWIRREVTPPPPDISVAEHAMLLLRRD